MVSSTFKRNSLGFFKFRCHHKSRVFQSFDGLLRIAIIISFPLAITIGYFYLFPNFHPAVIDLKISNSSMLSKKCNLFEGSWTKDEIYPLYNASLCPFTERGFNCLANGRKDKDYLKWRWKPHNCDIPRFNASVILKKLSGKQIVFVGDSMSRTQWESMICLLMNGVDDKESVHEVNGNKITKQIRFLGVRFSLFNFTVKFYRSVFLVQPGSVPRGAPKRVRSTLRLDKLDGCSREWIDADVLVFNTGQWWTPRKLFDM